MFYAQSTSTVISGRIVGRGFFNSKVQVKGPVDRNYAVEMSGRGGAAWSKHPGTRSRLRGGDQKKDVHL